MESPVASAQPKYQWRTLILFALLAIPAVLAILPYSMAISASAMTTPPPKDLSVSAEEWAGIMRWSMVLISVGQAVLVTIPLAALGLLFAKWTGLDAPFIRALLYREPKPAGFGRSFGRALIIGTVTGLVFGGLLLVLSQYVFGPMLDASMAAAGISIPEIRWSWWDGLLASMGAAVNEELCLRLFLLNGLAWFGGLLLGKKSGRPAIGLLWAANILSALAFGSLHIFNIMAIGMPVDLASISSTLVLNGIIGVLFGWLYWKYGLESAMASHFAVDIILKVVILLFI